MPDPQQSQPPIQVEVQGVGTVEFPAGTSQAEMESALTKLSDHGGKDPSLWERFSSAAGEATDTMLAPYKFIGRTVLNNQAAVGATIGAVTGGIPGAALGGAAGQAFQQLTNRAMGRPAPATPFEAAKDIGIQGAVQGGLQAIGEGVGKIATPALKWAGGRLMQSALGTGAIGLDAAQQAAKKGTIPKVVQTLLDEGVNVTPGGVAKLQTILGETNQAVKDAIAPMTGDIERPVVAARAYSAANKMTEQTNPRADLQALGKEVEEFLNPVIDKGPISPQQAQAMKVGTYKKIGDKYGTPAELNPAQVQAQMAFARGLKEEIERLAAAQGRPNVKVLNAREGKILEALEATSRKVAQARGLNPAGFAFVAHAPATFLAALIDRSPAAKSMLARGLYNSAATATGVSPTLLRATVAAISAQDEE